MTCNKHSLSPSILKTVTRYATTQLKNYVTAQSPVKRCLSRLERTDCGALNQGDTPSPALTILIRSNCKGARLRSRRAKQVLYLKRAVRARCLNTRTKRGRTGIPMPKTDHRRTPEPISASKEPLCDGKAQVIGKRLLFDYMLSERS